MKEEAKSAVEKYREKQKRKNTRKMYVARKLAMITGLLFGTILVEFVILGPSADKAAWASALFWGGALWICLGTLGGMGSADSNTLSRTSPVILGSATTILSRSRLQDREKQIALMLIMMVAGAILIFLAAMLIYVM